MAGVATAEVADNPVHPLEHKAVTDHFQQGSMIDDLLCRQPRAATGKINLITIAVNRAAQPVRPGGDGIAALKITHNQRVVFHPVDGKTKT
ncbi:hypothetical protein VIAE108258_22100 [Vibrio aerogenes]